MPLAQAAPVYQFQVTYPGLVGSATVATAAQGSAAPAPSQEPTTVNLTIATNTPNYNLFTAAGSPTTAQSYVVTIASGVVVSGNPAFTIPATMPAGSTLTLVNNGSIQGTGGAGGIGSNYAGTAGGIGSTAISTTMAFTLDNTNGTVFAGGGGGGAGGRSECGAFGGNGGIGQGSASLTAGTGAIPFRSGAGGQGGGWGASGTAGAVGYYSGCLGISYSGGAGGAGGNAIQLNGKTVTWAGGNTAAKVKGFVN